MGLKLPQEIEVWYIIPAIRREFAKVLVKKGLKQREVARILGVTDAAVSQYFSSKRGSEVRFNQRIKKEIKESVDRVMKGKDILAEIQGICRECKKDKICCFIHKHHGAPDNCRVCFPD
jgi:predicted transcriptional regulator